LIRQRDDPGVKLMIVAEGPAHDEPGELDSRPDVELAEDLAEVEVDGVPGQEEPLLGRLARRSPLLAGADAVAFVDVDDTVKPTFGYAKQGAGYGYTGVKGLNALLATVSTPTAAPVP
jgi:hypothetical protein